MALGNIGTSEVNLATRDAIGTTSQAYEAARDHGDTLEAARAILRKIGLLNETSLTRETTKSSRDIEEAAFLQDVASWVEDEKLSPDDIIQNMLQMIGTSGSTDSTALDSFLHNQLSLDLNEFKEILADDRDTLDKQIESAVKLSSTHSNTQAMTLKDLLYQRNVLLSLEGEIIDLIQGLRSILNNRG